MIAAGLWLDVVIVAGLVLLYYVARPAPATAGRSSAVQQATTRGGRHLAGRLERYYTTVVRQAGFEPATSRFDYALIKLLLTILPPLMLLDAGVPVAVTHAHVLVAHRAHGGEHLMTRVAS